MRDRGEPERRVVAELEPSRQETGLGKETLAQHEPAQSQDHTQQVRRAALSGHAGRAYRIMDPLPEDELVQIAQGIGADARFALAKNTPDAVRRDTEKRRAMRIMFDNTPDTELATLDRFIEARFEIDLGGRPETPGVGKGKRWDALGMRRLWKVLRALPPEHVSSNWALVWLERYQDGADQDPTHARGYYNNQGEAGISYQPDVIRTGGTTDHDVPGDPLHGVNRFDEVARHEVGHAVDLQLGFPSDRLVQTPEAGNWKVYEPNDYREAAREMIELSNGPIEALPRSERKDIIDAMVESMKAGNPAKFNRAITRHDDRSRLELDPVYAIMNGGFAKQDPWKTVGTVVGGRHYHETYKKRSWVSYDAQAFNNHRVSVYQFRAPGEWFAECYAAFYSPQRGEASGTVVEGSRLQQNMPRTHAWFKNHIDDRKEVRQRAERVRREFRAPRKD